MSTTPNLLFLYTDEQRFDTLACYGNARIAMPNLNRFAETATVFDRAYVTQPVCTPSRSSLLTGRYPHANGCTENNVPLAAETPCLPEMLPAGAYATGHLGKWHLGDEIFAQHGFEAWRSIEDGYARYYSEGRDPEARSSYHHWLVENGFSPGENGVFSRMDAARLPEEFGKPAYLAGEAVRFLREHRHDPFVLYVNFLEPHMPFTGPRDDQYDPGALPLPPNFDAPPTEAQPLKARLLHRYYAECGLGLETEAGWRRVRANYWGLNSLVDTHVGTILDELDALGLADNTIVVFTSDHGDMMGSHRLLAKCVAFEEAIRVPLLIRRPGQSGPRRIEGPVSQIDLVPTLLEMLGHEPAAGLQGCSLAPHLESGAPVGRDVVVEWNGADAGGIGVEAPGRCRLPGTLAEMATPAEAYGAITDPVRTLLSPDGWKLNCSPRGEHELYNLREDPGERNNRARVPEEAGRLAALRERLGAWQAATGDTAPLPASF